MNKYGCKYDYEDGWDIYHTIKTTDITKHSPNLIDLISVGDFINEEQMTAEKLANIDDKCIKTVLTRGQYYKMAYKVEEE